MNNRLKALSGAGPETTGPLPRAGAGFPQSRPQPRRISFRNNSAPRNSPERGSRHRKCRFYSGGAFPSAASDPMNRSDSHNTRGTGCRYHTDLRAAGNAANASSINSESGHGGDDPIFRFPAEMLRHTGTAAYSLPSTTSRGRLPLMSNTTALPSQYFVTSMSVNSRCATASTTAS